MHTLSNYNFSQTEAPFLPYRGARTITQKYTIYCIIKIYSKHRIPFYNKNQKFPQRAFFAIGGRQNHPPENQSFSIIKKTSEYNKPFYNKNQK